MSEPIESEIVDEWRRAHELRKARIDAHHRRPPMPYYRTPGRGFCRWCGDAILKPDGSVNLRRSWHSDCARAYLIAVDSKVQRRVAWERAGGVCQGCGTDLARQLVPKRSHYRDYREGELLAFHGPRGITGEERIPTDGPCCGVMWRHSEWQADHDVPLWSVDKTRPDALRFWGPENLRLLCDRCHKAKSAGEAAMRAKGKRQHAKIGRPVMSIFSPLRDGHENRHDARSKKRKLPSRPFPKAHRPLRAR